jgi:EAL domain-containing protein (putative c-di-GMP-specific phosphodiesterase class I)
LFLNIKERQPLKEFATRLLEIVKEQVFLCGAKSYVDFSIGAVFSDDKRVDVDAFIRQAELAFLHCKTHIDTNYAEFSENLAESVKRLSSLETGLREALETGQIDLHYQPLISSDLESMIGVEALARWNHPKLGKIPPQEFVLIAEALGLTAKLGNVVLREACRSIKPIPELKLAVNISTHHFLNPNFIEDVDKVLELTGFDPNRLEIEITENALIGANDRANLVVKELQSRGIAVALDDFGTGYTSLAYLNQFCVDRVKIDAEFIKKVGVDQNAQSTFSSIIELVEIHGFNVTVEGVETVEQIMFLKKFKNLCYQGFLFSKPLPYLDLIKSDYLGHRDNSTSLRLSQDD